MPPVVLEIALIRGTIGERLRLRCMQCLESVAHKQGVCGCRSPAHLNPETVHARVDGPVSNCAARILPARRERL